ncbi:MAG: PRC-barrel domain-containing protein [Rubrobacteraceae bacterium]
MSEGSSTARGNVHERIVDDYSGYKVYDENGGKIGKVEYTVLDRDNNPEYLAVNTGFFGTKTTLIPERIVRLREQDREFDTQTSEAQVKDAPTFDHKEDITPDLESRVLDHFGLGSRETEQRSAGEEHDRASSGSTASAGPREHSSSSRFRADREESRSSDEDRETDDERRESSEDRSPAAAGSGTEERRSDEGSDRERVRVTVKREKVRAERIRGEDGQAEVRIRKEMVEEEELVEVEDRMN